MIGGVLLDLSGVRYVGEEVLPGARIFPDIGALAEWLLTA